MLQKGGNNTKCSCISFKAVIGGEGVFPMLPTMYQERVLNVLSLFIPTRNL